MYEVSSLGAVRSWNAGHRGVRVQPLVMKPQLDRRGYRTVALKRGTKQEQRHVHFLVALAFIGPRPFGKFVCHNDGNSVNNRVENLRYDTAKGNAADRGRHGTQQRGEESGTARLTEELVRYIRQRHARGDITYTDLGAELGVTGATVSNVVRGRTWGWLE